MARRQITRTSGVAHINIVPAVLQSTHITAFESLTPEWLDESYYEAHEIFTAICARMVNRRTNPHDHADALNAFRNEVSNLPKGSTARVYIGGHTIVIWHRDCALRLHYELTMY
jgi:hypothetical protein